MSEQIEVPKSVQIECLEHVKRNEIFTCIAKAFDAGVRAGRAGVRENHFAEAARIAKGVKDAPSADWDARALADAILLIVTDLAKETK